MAIAELEFEDEAPAIKALGSLFKLTQVFLWGDGFTETRDCEDSTFLQPTKPLPNADEPDSVDDFAMDDDLELIKQMNTLGLPLSFHTNKERRNGMTRGTRKETSKKPVLGHEEKDSGLLESIEVSERDLVKEHNSADKTSNSDGEIFYGKYLIKDSSEHDLIDLNGSSMESVSLKGASMAAHEIEHDELCVDLGNELCEEIESKCNGVFGNWRAYWDTFFVRNYFYNVETQESTWDPPPGMEYLAFGEFTNELTEMASDAAEMDDHMLESGLKPGLGLCEESTHEDQLQDQLVSETFEAFELASESVLTTVVSKRKKKQRRIRSRRKISKDHAELELQGNFEDFSTSIDKYWCQRYQLFSKFDDGVKMDEEGWFSVTPEAIAKHHASRCGSGIVVDCFTGVGGNSIHFARRCEHVIAIDIDSKKIDYAQHNAAIYGVDDRIEFIKGDAFLLASKLKANTVFLSPPWGGPDYAKVKKYDMKTMLKPHDGLFLFNIAKRIAPKIVMFLPRNVDINQLAELSLSQSPPWSLEVEKNFLNGKLKAITAYFNEPFV